VLVRDFVPMRKLLPHCAALVHHGGIGTAALAFEAGIAQVVTPFAHDQFDNAQRVAQSGCGIRIDSPASGKALASALSRIATDPWVAARCTIARQRIGTAPDACEAAAQYIERLAERRAAAGTRPADRKTLGTARSI
jgi:rhamnosyltransferase subunit B